MKRWVTRQDYARIALGSVETSFLGRMIFILKRYTRELRRRAARLVLEHRSKYQTEYAAIRPIAANLGIATPETLGQWIRQALPTGGGMPGNEPFKGRRGIVCPWPYQPAREMHEDILARRRRVLGEDHPDTLESARGLAVDLGMLGEHRAARELDEDTLARRRS